MPEVSLRPDPLSEHLSERFLPDVLIINGSLEIIKAKGHSLERLHATSFEPNLLISQLEQETIQEVQKALKECREKKRVLIFDVKWAFGGVSTISLEAIPSEIDPEERLYSFLWTYNSKWHDSQREFGFVEDLEEGVDELDNERGTKRLLLIGQYYPLTKVFEAEECVMKAFGLTNENPLSSWLNAIHPDERKLLTDTTKAIIAGKTNSSELSYKYINPVSGALQFYRTHSLVISKNEEGLVTEILIVSVENTRQISIENELRSKIKSLWLTQEISKLGVWQYTVYTDEKIWSERNKEIFGFDPNNTDQTWAGNIHPEDQQQALQALENFMQEPNKFEYDSTYRYIDPRDKQLKYIHNMGKAVLIEKNGKVAQMVGVTRDETTQKKKELSLLEALQHEKELREDLKTELRLNDLAANASMLGLWKWDVQNKNLSANDQYWAMTGLPQENAFDIWIDHVHKDDRERIRSSFERHLNGEFDHYDEEYRYSHPIYGKERIIRTTAIIANRDKADKATLKIGVTRDITDQRNKEEELFFSLEGEKFLKQELSKRLSQIDMAANTAKLGIWQWDIKADFISANDQYWKIMGVPKFNPKEVWEEHIHPDDKERVSGSMLALIKGEISVYKEEYRYRHPKRNEELHIRTNAVLVNDQHDDKSKIIIGITHDISADYHREKVVEDALKFNQKLTQKSNFGVFVHDLNTHQDIYADPNCEAIHGYSMEEVNEMHEQQMRPLIHAHDYEKVIGVFHDLSLKSEDDTAELDGRMITKDGQTIWCRFNFSVFEIDKTGKPTKLLGLFKDVTSKKNLELELVESKKKSEMANVFKNSFISNMSHEIRTPMNGVVACSQLLRDDDLKQEEKDQFINIIQSSSKQLLHIVDDIIDVARMDSGDLHIQEQKVNIAHTLEELYQTFVQIKKSEGHQIDFVKNLEDKLDELELVTDPIRLKQIITNFLGNAFKFCKEGRVELGLKTGVEGYEIYVSDEGIGIPKEKQELIFDRFTQVEYTTHSKFGGKGLGLAICKGLAHLLGASISVESEEGRGAKFTLTLPFPKDQIKEKKVNKKKNGALSIPDLSGSTILYVDDEINLRFYLRKVLEPTGATLFEATNGKDAIELFRKHQPHVVLMDIRMPIMDGFIATEKILELDKNAQVIIQSAHALPDERDKAREIGCVEYMTKPLDRDLLYHLTESSVNKLKRS